MMTANYARTYPLRVYAAWSACVKALQAIHERDSKPQQNMFSRFVKGRKQVRS